MDESPSDVWGFEEYDGLGPVPTAKGPMPPVDRGMLHERLLSIEKAILNLQQGLGEVLRVMRAAADLAHKENNDG